MRKSKKHFLIGLLVLGVTGFGVYYGIPEEFKKDKYFSYKTESPDDIYVQVTTNKPVSVDFEFEVGEHIPKISLRVKDAFLLRRGVSLEQREVLVINGLASSRALFAFTAEDKIKPGTYYLRIAAEDTATGRIIRSGTIPFIVDILETIAKCSC